jgi:thiol reductant ABC exporter CydC subunit
MSATTASGRLNTVATPDPLMRAIRLTGLRAGPLIQAVAAGAMTLLSSVGLAAASAWLIVRASQAPPVLTLQICVVLVRLFGITRGLFRYLERLATHRVALSGMTELRVRLYERLAAGRLASTALLRRGDLLARVGADVEDVGDLVVRGVVPGLVAVVLVGLSSAFIAIFVPLAGLSLLVCLLAAGILAPLATVRSARLAELHASAARASVSATAMTMLEHGDELAVGGTLKASQADLAGAERRLFRALDRASRPAGLAVGLTEALIAVAVIACFVFGSQALDAGAISPEVLAVVVLTPLACFEAVSGLPAAAAQVYRSRAAASRIVDLLDSAAPDGGASETGWDRASKPHSPAEVPPVDLPEGAALQLRDVTCGWVADRPVLTGVNLTVAPGQAIAIVGPSGAGKTTLLATLAGLLPPLAGTLGVGGVPLAALPRRQMAQTVAFVAEDAHVFATSVLENLRVANGKVNRSEAREALEATGLGLWLDGLPDGLETLLGPDGSTISGGERRRLLLARALLSPARFLVLDEPAEHLDPDSADRLTALMLGLAHKTGRGVVLVTHRLGALDDADEVAIVDDRHLAAHDPHQRLVDTNNAHRAALGTEEEEW